MIDLLSDPFSLCEVPGYIRSDNEPESKDHARKFIAKAVQDAIAAVRLITAYIEPGSP